MRNLLKAFFLALDEIVVVAIAIYILWRFGVNISGTVIAITIVASAIWVLFVHRIILSISRRRQVGGKEGMIGRRGKVVSPLKPEGTIKIRGEIWKASALEHEIDINDEVLVIDVKGLILLVKKVSA